jgi:hypothetical protein
LVKKNKKIQKDVPSGMGWLYDEALSGAAGQ